MAHIQKLKAHATGQLFAHINRDRATIDRYGNKDIDSSKTHLNYDIIHGDLEKIQVRLSEVKHQKRDDLVTLCACVITLPGDLIDSSKEDQKKFFITATEFMKQKFGENNVIYATVHNDETTPHLHVGFVPVTQIKRKYRSKAKQGQTYTEERISAKAVVNRNMLKSFHTELDQYVEKYFQKCEILNGALKNRQNISIGELKARTEEMYLVQQDAINKLAITQKEFDKACKVNYKSVYGKSPILIMGRKTAQRVVEGVGSALALKDTLQYVKDQTQELSVSVYEKRMKQDVIRMQDQKIKALERENQDLKTENNKLKDLLKRYVPNVFYELFQNMEQKLKKTFKR